MQAAFVNEAVFQLAWVDGDVSGMCRTEHVGEMLRGSPTSAGYGLSTAGQLACDTANPVLCGGVTSDREYPFSFVNALGCGSVPGPHDTEHCGWIGEVGMNPDISEITGYGTANFPSPNHATSHGMTSTYLY